MTDRQRANQTNPTEAPGKFSGKWTAFLTWALRLLLGAVFTYSGFVKAIDPWGTIYKFQEYLSALGISVLPTLLLVGVFALCTMEFLIGVFYIFGCYRRGNPIMALAMMCVMLPLTLWIALKNPVADCGCFGDALVISNWATFWKNVVITAAVVWTVKFNRRCTTIISPAFQWMALLASALFVIAIGIYGYGRQPLIDFRNYPVGSRIVDEAAADSADSEADNLIFVYEKDGVEKEFGVDDVLPSEEDGWHFVERREVAADSDNVPAADEKTFRIWDIDGSEDVTSEVLPRQGGVLLLLIPELDKTSPAMTWKINSLYDWSEARGIGMIAVVSGSEEEISRWEDLSMPEYDIYTADDTAIKEVARGNPALVYVKDGIVRWKSALSAIDVDDFMQAGISRDPMTFAPDNRHTLLNCLYIYICCMAVLVSLSMLPRLRNVYSRHNMLGRFRRRVRKLMKKAGKNHS